MVRMVANSTPKTLSQLAAEAILVQDACNSGGVAHLLRETLSTLSTHYGMGTDEKNRHPIVRIIIAKLADLAGMEVNYDDFHRAYTECQCTSQGVDQ